MRSKREAANRISERYQVHCEWTGDEYVVDGLGCLATARDAEKEARRVHQAEERRLATEGER